MNLLDLQMAYLMPSKSDPQELVHIMRTELLIHWYVVCLEQVYIIN